MKAPSNSVSFGARSAHRLTIPRLLPTVIVPMVLAAGLGIIFHHNDFAPAATAPAVVASTDLIDRDDPLVPRDRRDISVYSARRQGEAETRVYVQHRGHAPELVYMDPEPGDLAEVNADGSRGVFRRFIEPGKYMYITINLSKHQS